MFVRRYGAKIHEVTPRFDARALSEIGFEKQGESWPAEEFLAEHEPIDTREVSAYAEGAVKDEVELALLQSLREELNALEREFGEDTPLLIENQSGNDYPKTRDRTTGERVAGERRLQFSYTVDPPLRVRALRPRTP
ncbi:MAG: hypothetical protein ACRELD_14495 [Longimicrobiales bacterium]